MEMRKRLKRPLTKWLKEDNKPPLGQCFTCHRENCPSFRDLEGMSKRDVLWNLKHRIVHPHPLYICPKLALCPQEHLLIHRVLYHHPLYTPRQLVTLRILLAAMVTAHPNKVLRIPRFSKWAHLPLKRMTCYVRQPSEEQCQRQALLQSQLLPLKDSLHQF